MDGVYQADHSSFKIAVFPSGRVEIKGSLHKYYAGGANYSTFSLLDVRIAIGKLTKELCIAPEKLVVHNLEFGVNLNTSFEPQLFLRSLVVYKNQPFNTMKIKGQGYGKECYLSHYGIKVYDKGTQYTRPEKILRFEKKVFKMQAIHAGATTLRSLLDESFIQVCSRQLIDSYSKVIVTEKVDLKNLTKPETKLFIECKNPLNWESFTRQQRLTKRSKFHTIVAEHGKQNLRVIVGDLLQQKLTEITSTTLKTSDVLTDIHQLKTVTFLPRIAG